LMAMMLRALGYEVVTAVDGAEAVARFVADRGAFDLVVMDIQMPNMRGDEALARMAELDPEVRALVVSGHRLDADGLVAARAFLHKPFDLAAFSRKVAEALAAPAPPGSGAGL